jgi:hypothetical protein
MGHFGRVMGWELRPWQGTLAAEAQRDDKLDLRVLRDRLQLEDSSRRGWRGDPSESASRLPGQLGNGLPERLAGARSPRFTGPRDDAAAAKSGGMGESTQPPSRGRKASRSSQDFCKTTPLLPLQKKNGLSAQQIEILARQVSEPGKRVSWWWTMGVNQSHEGVRTAQAIINLYLITGNFGKPGTGASSITGLCNAMGSHIFSNTTSLVGGHDFQDPAHRKKSRSGSRDSARRHPNGHVAGV